MKVMKKRSLYVVLLMSVLCGFISCTRKHVSYNNSTVHKRVIDTAKNVVDSVTVTKEKVTTIRKRKGKTIIITESTSESYEVPPTTEK